MKFLAIETTQQACSVALWHDGRISEQIEPAARRQTERVLPMSQALLAEAGWRLNQLDGLAFSHGPGAFTGVRVGASVVQGLSLAADLPVVGVSSLAATAESAAESLQRREATLVVFDARMQEIYLAGYVPEADGWRVSLADCLASPETPPALAETFALVVGSGVVYRERLASHWPGAQWHEDIGPSAAAVARLAAPRLLAGEGVSAERALPVYLRDQVTRGVVR